MWWWGWGLDVVVGLGGWGAGGWGAGCGGGVGGAGLEGSGLECGGVVGPGREIVDAGRPDATDRRGRCGAYKAPPRATRRAPRAVAFTGGLR